MTRKEHGPKRHPPRLFQKPSALGGRRRGVLVVSAVSLSQRWRGCRFYAVSRAFDAGGRRFGCLLCRFSVFQIGFFVSLGVVSDLVKELVATWTLQRWPEGPWAGVSAQLLLSRGGCVPHPWWVLFCRVARCVVRQSLSTPAPCPRRVILSRISCRRLSQASFLSRRRRALPAMVYRGLGFGCPKMSTWMPSSSPRR